ncbi:MAG: META domain-containing protein [Candidatus Promineifilaceae bacterium]
MKKLRVIAIFVMLALVLIACQKEEPTPTAEPKPVEAATEAPAEQPGPAEEPVAEPSAAEPEDIVGIVWQWEAFQDQADQNNVEVDDPTSYTVTLLPDGHASIKADCNQVNMGYSLEGNSITFVGPGMSTLAMCPPDSLDQQFLGYLEDVVTWVMSPEEKLVFNLKADAGNMYFNNGGTAAAPAAVVEDMADITNIVWQWEAFQDTAGQNDIIVDDSSRYTVSLLDDGTASIKADCNQVNMPYVMEGSSLTFTGPGMSTMAACPPDSLDQQFLEYLSNVASWVMTDDGKLVLNLFADAGNMVFSNGGEVGAQPAASIEDIQMIVWQWSGLVETSPAAQSVVPDPENYTIAFLPDGSAPITADCNQVGATYSADGDSLTIVLGPATAAFCGEESLDQQYLGLLSTVATFALEGESLKLNLANDAGQMNFTFGEKLSALDIDPDDISLDTQGLADSWEAYAVPATPYDESMPPGPMGMPEHIEITFNGQTPETVGAFDPVMYIIPIEAYEAQWEMNGNDSVTQLVDDIYQLTVALPYPPPHAGLPVLPVEEVRGVQDLAVQVGRASSTESSASKNGFRFVGRFAQDMNPVTSDGLPLQYIYQGFTNDSKYAVSLFWVVNSDLLPTNADIDDSFNNAISTEGGYQTFLDAQAEVINSFSASDWTPDLAKLDNLVGSLVISGMPESGIQGQVWQLTGQTSAPGGEVTPAGGTPDYFVIYSRDGEMVFTADCNSGRTMYDVTGGMSGGIAMQPAAVTLAACGPDSDSDLMINGLTSSQNYRVHPGGVVLEQVRPAGGGSLFFASLGEGEVIESDETQIELPPADDGQPTGTVAARSGVNVRSGPGTNYPIVGWAPNGASGQIIGRSADGGWWATPYTGGTGGIAWVSAAYVSATNVENVPVIPAPPPPQPTPTPTPDNTPTIQFWADTYNLSAGQCTTIRWEVENVTAVWVYPVGQPYDQYPTTGSGSQQVCPSTTTTYELRVQLNDGSVQIRQVTINVQSTNPLVGSSWAVASIYVTQVPIPGASLTLSFDTANSASGSGGCNNFTTPYSVSGNAIYIGPIQRTNATCSADIDNQEQVYVSAMQSATSYQLVGSQLVLYSSVGQELVRYNRTG